jgi:thiamine-monophosphate kinase
VATDLMHICRASGVGARLDAAELPVPAGVRAVARLAGREFWEPALLGGEDYQLLFTCPPERAPRVLAVFTQAGLEVPSRIGEIVAGKEVVLFLAEKEKIISGAGYEHFRLDAGETAD